jgi:5-methylcytosine-specific restriction endonuclease McrA
MSWRLRKVPKCGTTRGYDYHTRQLKELPCTLCRTAKSNHWKVTRLANRDYINARRRELRKIRTEYETNSAARRKGKFVGDYSHELVLDVYGNVCHLCQASIDLEAPRQVGRPGWELGLHIDHVIPISKGGPDALENVRPAHGYCNQTKGSKC